MALIATALRLEIEGAIVDSRTNWREFLEINRLNSAVSPFRGSSRPSLAMKYVAPKWAHSYTPKDAQFGIGNRAHTWGTGTYVTGIAEPVSTAIYGRIGIVGTFDGDAWRAFDARTDRNRALYMDWLHAQPVYADAVLTVHTDHFLHGLRNLFREQFRIDAVLFNPDELDSMGWYTDSADTWVAVSDWTSSRSLRAGLSDRFAGLRMALLIEEEFAVDDPALTRSPYLGLSRNIPRLVVDADMVRSAYVNHYVLRVRS